MHDLKPKKSSNSDRKLSLIQFCVLLFYLVLIISLAIAITLNSTLKNALIERLSEIRSDLSIKWYFILFFIGIALTIIGFPIMLYELAIGYILDSYWLALILDILFKSIGCFIIFLIARFLLKDKIAMLLENSLIFKAVQRGTERNPFKSALLIKLMLLPHVIKNYGLGITEIPLKILTIVTILVSAIFGSIWVYFGRGMKDLHDVLGHTEKTEGYLIVRYCLLGMTVVIMVVLFIFAKRYFDELKKEIEEEEKEKLLREKPDYGTLSELKKNVF